MKYNFDNLANRKNSDSIKWIVKDDELPMWIADQDFKCLPQIKEAILNKLNVEAYGYQDIPNSIFVNSANWYNKRYNSNFNPEKMLFCEGVVATITSTIRHLLNKGDNVTIITPVYNIFFNSIINNECNPIQVELNEDESINFEILEEAFKISKLFILCNPHNPVGKIYTKNELEKIGELAHKYHLIVISDEIHCDFLTEKSLFTSFSCVNEVNREISITCISPSKTFNVAGMKGSLIHIFNDDLYQKVKLAINHDEVAEPNFFVCDVINACYLYGSDYVDQMNAYIYQNKLILKEFVDEYLPHVKYEIKDALYLAWLDLSFYQDEDIASRIKDEVGLILSNGKIYGNGGKYFVRMNLATSHEYVKIGLNMLKKALNKFEK